MRVLIVDNYDSFTFNIFQIVARHSDSEPIVVRNRQIGWRELLELEPDCVILSPGPGHPANPEDFGICADVIANARAPILGVCLGHQGIATAFGGSVTHAPEPMHGRRSAVSHDGSALFAGVPQRFEAVRYHSFCVAEPLPPILEAIAWTDDRIVMGLRHRSRPIWGVQFHPESIGTECGERILGNFVELARGISGRRSSARWTTPASRISVVPRALPEAERGLRYRLHHRAIEGPWTAEQIFMELFGHEPLAFWLDSSRLRAGEARFSFMGGPLGPLGETLRYDATKRALSITRRGENVSVSSTLWDYLDEELKRRRIACSDDLPFDFTCGFVGYLGYELRSDGSSASRHAAPRPDAELVFADRMLALDHDTNVVYLLSVGLDTEEPNASDAWLDATETQLRALRPARPPATGSSPTPLTFRWSRDRREYTRDLERTLEHIRNGETYEVCLTNQIHTRTNVDPLDFYRTLRASNPAPYAAYLRFGRTAIASSSPERFLKVDRERGVEAKPIKGTAPRGASDEVDRELADALRTGEKSRAENLMIVDLLRNDLALVCSVGSVTVPRLMHIESYATVHQLVTTVRGRLRQGLGVVDCVRAAFPGGSMTGAPKIRTMELIDQLESEARGVYSGAIGFFSLNATMDLSVVIRTAVFDEDEVSIGVGGAVVSLSTADAEFEETLLKARALLRALIVATSGPDDADARLSEAEESLRGEA